MWFADEGAGFFVVHLSDARSYSSTRSFFPPWLPPIRYSFPLATAFQYSSSGTGTAANFCCVSHRPGDCATAVIVPRIAIAAIAASVRVAGGIIIVSFAKRRPAGRGQFKPILRELLSMQFG